MKTTTWADECSEWERIRIELIDGGTKPSAFDVSAEQERRMAARGQRRLTLEEIQKQVYS